MHHSVMRTVLMASVKVIPSLEEIVDSCLSSVKGASLAVATFGSLYWSSTHSLTHSLCVGFHSQSLWLELIKAVTNDEISKSGGAWRNSGGSRILDVDWFEFARDSRWHLRISFPNTYTLSHSETHGNSLSLLLFFSYFLLLKN